MAFSTLSLNVRNCKRRALGWTVFEGPVTLTFSTLLQENVEKRLSQVLIYDGRLHREHLCSRFLFICSIFFIMYTYHLQ